MAAPPSSPVKQPVRADADPLVQSEPFASSSSPTPISFKRRTPSRSLGIRTGLLGGILSRSNEDDVDKVPSMPFVREDAPKKIAMPPSPYGSRDSNVLYSDEEELDDGQRTPTGTERMLGHGFNQQRMLGQGGKGPGRISFGAEVGRPPRRGDPYSPSIGSGSASLSPGGRRDGASDFEGEKPYSTPLPTIPMLVLCIAMFGEFLCASTSSPFLYFMIEDFGVGKGKDGGGEAAVGFWTGIVGSTFFLSQFLTSLLWVSVAERHGRRAVLFSSLLGNSLTLMAFGTSKNLGTAICIRLGMGLFNGAVGVARGAVQTISDPSNESRAFTYMGLCWGLGGIVGSIVGGLAENPIRNHPTLFASSPFLTDLFTEYPYLLPCLIAGSVTFTGAILSLFLGPDGGPREGGIHLPTEKDVERAATTFGALPRQLVHRVSTYFQSDAGSSGFASHPERVALHRSSSQPGVPGPASPASLDESRFSRNPLSMRRTSTKQSAYGSAYGYNPLAMSRTSTRASGTGSAYGYDGARFPPNRRNIRPAFRSASAATSTRYAPDYDDVEHQDLNFAQRLLLANDQAIFSISDLWVAQATQNEEPYDERDYSESGLDEDDESRLDIDDGGDEPDFFGYGTAPPSLDDLRGTARRQDDDQGRVVAGSPSLTVPRTRTMDSRRRSPSRERIVSYGGSARSRRDTFASLARSPAIFANTGLNPQSLGSAALMSPPIKSDQPGDSAFNPMAAIPETRAPSIIEIEEADVEADRAPPVPLLRQLPLVMIGQYALLALHGTVCDQVFMSFLVTPVPSGGLGLKASNYAALVAAMFFFSMVWQFRFYGSVGPPGGSLSHLAMFRLGLALYIPVYMLFPELRGLLQEDANGWVMLGMTLLSAIRYLANTCSYTAVMVLINAMSPPHLVPLANGLAQSAVSLARFIGPILGGTIWAASIADGPSAHAWPFNYAAGFVAISIICAVGFMHSFRIH